jgi:hypothetical protein
VSISVRVFAGPATVANAILRRTDGSATIAVRPATAAVEDRTLTPLLGHVHRIADHAPGDARHLHVR